MVDQQAVLHRVVAWAAAHWNVRAAVLTGSVARGQGDFDALSDLDIELYVREPSELLDQASWYEQFGDVLLVEALENPGWHPTRLVYYSDGKIDFMIAAASVLADGVFYERPFKALLDKDNVQGFHRRAPRPDDPPACNEFVTCVQEFYAAILMWATYLIRDDPWSAKVRDWDSKRLLLRMLEWDTKARKGWECDTWRFGAHLREWADREVVSKIETCWCGVSRESSLQSLRESVSLFEVLSFRTAIALGLEPFDTTRIRRRLEELVGEAR